MSAAIVQHANYSSGAGTTLAASITLATAPKPGNVLIAVFGFTSAENPVTPTGWTNIDTYQPGNASLLSCYRIVQPGDGTTWNMTVLTAFADSLAAVMYEISGAPTSSLLVNQHTLNNSAAATSIATTAATPTRVPGCVCIAVVTSDAGSTAGADVATVSAGWTIDERPFPTFHGMRAASRNGTTIDNTSITATFSAMSSSVNAVTLIIIAPQKGFVVKSLRPHPFSPGLAR